MASESPVRSVGRALAILRSFDVLRPEQTLDELAAAGDVPKSTAHRLLQGLVASKLVEPATRPGSYRLTLEVARLGAVAAADGRVAQDISARVSDLRDETGETVGLSVRDGLETVVVERAESWHALSYRLHRGSRLPGDGSAVGRVLLAQLSADALGEALDADRAHHIQLPRAELAALLHRVRQQGFAIDDDDHEKGLRCVAVAVPKNGEPSDYGIAISGSSARLSLDRLHELVPRLREVATELADLMELQLASARIDQV